MRPGPQPAAVTRHRRSLAVGTIGPVWGSAGAGRAHPLRAPCGSVRGSPKSIVLQGSVPTPGSHQVWGPLLAHHILSSGPCPSDPGALRLVPAAGAPRGSCALGRLPFPGGAWALSPGECWAAAASPPTSPVSRGRTLALPAATPGRTGSLYLDKCHGCRWRGGYHCTTHCVGQTRGSSHP